MIDENKHIRGLNNRVLRGKSCKQLCAKEEILIGIIVGKILNNDFDQEGGLVEE